MKILSVVCVPTDHNYNYPFIFGLWGHSPRIYQILHFIQNDKD